MAGNRPGRGRFGRARSCTEGSGGKSWNARRGGRGVCVCDLGWGRSKVAPSPPAETRLSALFPSRHPIGGGGGGGGGPPLETGPQLRTHRATASLPLPPPDSWCARVCLCVCVCVCACVWCRQRSMPGSMSWLPRSYTLVLGRRVSANLPPLLSPPVNEPDHER